MNKLTEEKVQKLIDFVQARPALYHKAHPSYKKVQQKEKMWKQIASNLCADVKDCKGAWRCLKDQFLRRLKELKGKTGQSTNDLCARYKNFERLLFLKDSLEPRQHCSNYDIELDEALDSDAVYADYDLTEVTEISRVHVPDLSPMSTGSEFVYASSASTSRKRQTSEMRNFERASTSQTTTLPEFIPNEENDNTFSNRSSAFSKRKKTEEINDDFSGFLQKISSSIETEEPDNISTFFDSIAKSAKAFKLSPLQMSKLMMGTTELLHEIVDSVEQP